MGLTRTEQWFLIVVVLLIGGGFVAQTYLGQKAGPVVWIEPGEHWEEVSAAESYAALTPSVASPESDPPSRLDDALAVSPPKSQRNMAGLALNSGTPLSVTLDLNSASPEELRLLPGIGPVKAEAIAAYRAQFGGFTTVDALLQVKGIGPKTLERLRPLVRVESGFSVPSGSAVPGATSPTSSPITANTSVTGDPIDLNLASAEELQQLKGIGPVLADRIVQSRLKAPFRSVDELRRVRGIGPATLEAIRDSIVVR